MFLRSMVEFKRRRNRLFTDMWFKESTKLFSFLNLFDLCALMYSKTEKCWCKKWLSWRQLLWLHLQHAVPCVPVECTYPHNIEPLEKQVISQQDVGLQQVLVVRVYSGSHSTVWGGTEHIGHIKTGWIRLDDKQMFWIPSLNPVSSPAGGTLSNTSTSCCYTLTASSLTNLIFHPPHPLPHILPLRTHSPEWMLMVVPTRLLFLCLFSHRKSIARRAWACA